MDMAAVIIQALLLPRTPHLRPAHCLLLEYQKAMEEKCLAQLELNVDWDVACCVVLCFFFFPIKVFQTTLNKSQCSLCFVLAQALKWAKPLRFTSEINTHLFVDMSSPIKCQRDRSSDIFYYGFVANFQFIAVGLCHSRRHSSIYLFHHCISWFY